MKIPTLLFGLISLLLIHTSLFSVETHAQVVRYVKPISSGTGDGTSWQNASNNLQSMMNAVQGSSGRVFVDRGLYVPVSPAGRYATFSIPSNVQVYGGFSGTEASLEERVLTMPSSTTLSGEIGSPVSTTDNSFHVVVFKNASSSTRLDGVVITAGRAGLEAGGSVFPEYVGGGIYNESRTGSSNPVIANCKLIGNRATEGGGMYNEAPAGQVANPTITACVFASNTATSGGGLYNYTVSNGQANPLIQLCQFRDNTASSGAGGGIMNAAGGSNGSESSPVITSCSFVNNRATEGGAMSNHARIASACKPLLANCQFSRNTATAAYGGAVYNFVAGSSQCTPVFVNCTFSKNAAIDRYQGFAGGIYNLASSGTVSARIVNCVFWGNTSAAFLSGSSIPSVAGNGSFFITNSDVEKLSNVSNCVQCAGNLDVDPRFVSPSTDNLQVQAGSSVIDKGTSSNLLGGINRDLAGQPRVSGCRIDMGAFEYQSAAGTIGTYTTKTGNWNDPSIWSCGQVPNTTDAVTLKHFVRVPDQYTGQALVINYETGGQLQFGLAGAIRLGL